LGRRAAARTQPAHSLEHRRRPARVDLVLGVGGQGVYQQVGDEPVVAGAAIVGGQRDVLQQ